MTFDPTFRRIMEPKPNWRITSDAVVIGEPVDYVGLHTFTSYSKDLTITPEMAAETLGGNDDE